MRVEIKSAANFLTNLLRVKKGDTVQNMNIHQLEQFCSKLEDMLCHHYQQHWFPEKPFKGSGYRCIRINHKMDPIISKAGLECGFDEEKLRQLFPDELTLWIDPKEVSYRIGENGSICVLFDERTVKKTCQVSNSWDRSPTRTVTITVNRNDNSDNSMSEDDCGSPMSMSPPSPVFDRMPSCKESMRGTGSNWDSFIMDPRNINYELSTYVSS
ncbi:protein BTG2-like [Uloborus diversus]|uniref:protein BTG2-like n=1 Tax=Uloborus diversus TaxID=327109 RepID=UPI002408FE48|nr:protein BTG2-like [Uloborus diversus]XP_054717944.1 protein BTG2-like [Uloborus diversus]